MIVLEPGCGMGFFTLPLARMVGDQGRVIAVDLQPRMLDRVAARAERTGLNRRIELRQAGAHGLNLEGLGETVDLVAAIHVVHEVPDAGRFFREVLHVLKPGGRLLMIEPRGHVSKEDFRKSVALAETVGFRPASPVRGALSHKVLLFKP
jgi:ubiquinone/menaquinone biosynthesis C-methylase UbiE